MNKKAISISLTDFVDFSIKAGTPKLTKVKEIMNRGFYSPSMDYWKQAREGIREYHETGSDNRDQLNNIYQGVKDTKKLVNYYSVAKAYKKFLGHKTISWFPPKSGVWNNGDLSVRVNPELGLVINGEKYLVKLYFKDEKLKRNRLDMVFEIMRTSLGQANEAKVSVLDISNSKLMVMGDAPVDLSALLAGEAASFTKIWNSLLNEE